MSQVKNLLKSRRVRVTLALLVIAIAVVLSFFGPKEPDPNIGLTTDPVTPTIGITNPVGNEPGVPRFAHAEPIHFPDAHVRHHLRRRNNDERNVLIGIDAPSPEIIARPHGVRARGKSHRKGQRFTKSFCFLDEWFQCFRIIFYFSFQPVFQTDGLAITI